MKARTHSDEPARRSRRSPHALGDEVDAVSGASTPTAARSLRAQRGAAAEEAVVQHLLASGVVVLARNVRVGRLEIDVVAREGPVIAIIEVRTRGSASWQRGLDSIDRRKRERIRMAGERLWRARFARDGSVERMRFDAASVTFAPNGDAQIEHIKAAF